MRSRGFIYLAVLIMISACGSEQKKSILSASKDDYDILNCTFIHLTYGRYMLSNPEFGYSNWNRKEFMNDESEEIEVLTIQKCVKNISTHAASYKYKDLEMADQSFKPLFDRLQKNSTDSSELDLKRITNIGTTKLKALKPKKVPEYDAPKNWILFSNFSYNEARTKAAFFYMRGDHSYFVFVKKVGKVWRIVDYAGIVDLGNIYG